MLYAAMGEKERRETLTFYLNRHASWESEIDWITDLGSHGHIRHSNVERATISPQKHHINYRTETFPTLKHYFAYFPSLLQLSQSLHYSNFLSPARNLPTADLTEGSYHY